MSLCMILSSVLESANLAFESAHLSIKSILYARPHVKSWDSKVKLNTLVRKELTGEGETDRD